MGGIKNKGNLSSIFSKMNQNAGGKGKLNGSGVRPKGNSAILDKSSTHNANRSNRRGS